MKTTQLRIGAIFSFFLIALCLSKLCLCLARNDPIVLAFMYPRTVYWTMLPLFLMTCIKDNLFSKILQFCLILSGSLWIFAQQGSADFFGIAGLTVAFFLAFHYGFFDKRKPVKICLCDLALFVAFSTFASFNDENKILHAVEILAFFNVFIFIIWAIFKDSIVKMKEDEDCQRERYMKIIDEATSVARDAIALCEKEKEKLERE